MRAISYVFFSQHLGNTRDLILGSCVAVSIIDRVLAGFGIEFEGGAKKTYG